MPPPRKFFDFGSQNGDLWCILGAVQVLVLFYTENSVLYVKLNPADELHYLQQRPRRNVQMPIRYWNSCFKDDHFVLFSACI